jgi:hypothetical protein
MAFAARMEYCTGETKKGSAYEKTYNRRGGARGDGVHFRLFQHEPNGFNEHTVRHEQYGAKLGGGPRELGQHVSSVGGAESSDFACQ